MGQVVKLEGTVYEKGYGIVSQKVMTDKNISHLAKAIYAYLSSFAFGGVDKERKSFPSVERQCKDLGITEKTYYKHRKQLEEAGYITIESVTAKKGKHNVYYIERVPHGEENPVKATGRGTGKEYQDVKSAGGRTKSFKAFKNLNNKTYNKKSYSDYYDKLPKAVQKNLDNPYQPKPPSQERQERLNAKLKLMQEKFKQRDRQIV